MTGRKEKEPIEEEGARKQSREWKREGRTSGENEGLRDTDQTGRKERKRRDRKGELQQGMRVCKEAEQMLLV